jgi:hypothetical protein
VRDELRFRQLARVEDGQGLVWIGADPPQAVSALCLESSTAMVMALSTFPEVPQPLLEPTSTLDGVSSLPVDDAVSHAPDAYQSSSLRWHTVLLTQNGDS